MNKNIILAFTLLIISLTTTCQYPVDVSELPDTEKFIFINAELTETYAKVLVTYTLDDVTPEGAYVFPKPPTATAYVLDGNGNQFFFKTDGVIDTSFRGFVGQTYTLHVEVDGKTYESNAETMRSCPELNTVTPIYTREPNRDAKDLLYDGFDVYVESLDPAGQDNYYQWDWVHYERSLSCAVMEENGREVLYPCTPYDCWNIRYNTRIIVQADRLRDGKSLTHRVVRVPFAVPPYKYYYLRVEQRAITPTVFAYLQSLETQTQNVGSVFDIPPQTRFSPNIYNVSNPTEKILGVFNVFSSRYKIINIDIQQEIPGIKPKNIGDPRPFTSIPLAQAKCVEGFYRTLIRPEGWVD